MPVEVGISFRIGARPPNPKSGLPMTGAGIAAGTLHDVLARVAGDHPEAGVCFPSIPAEITYRQLAESSRRMAAGLLERGVRPGEPVGILCPNAPEFLESFFSVLMAGAAACPLPLPMGLRTVGAYVRRLGKIAEASGMRRVLVSDQFGPLSRRLGDALPEFELVRVGALAVDAVPVLPAVEAGELALVQFTSGSTAAPKGVRLTHRNVLAGLEAINTGIDLKNTDSGGFWIPLFHDMGLFGTISGILTGLPMHLWSPADFVKRPARWLREFLASGATITAMPNFAYDYLVAAVSPEEAAALDLSRWRISFNGADSISAKSVEAFLDRFAPSGFRPEAMFQVYGMAEATLAVTFPPLGRAPRFDWVDRDVLAESGRVERVSREAPRARGVASVGRPVAGIDLRIVDPATGAPAGEDAVGEIQIRGVPVTSGYLSADSADACPMTPDGWLPTGDLAYRHDGEVFVTGRIKEMIKHRGASFYPQDVEAVAKAVSGIYKGRCVAVAGFGTEGHEDMLVVAETDLAGEAANRLTMDLRHRIQADLGLAQINVCLVAPSSLPRTSSGKFQRLAARELVRQSVN